MINGVRKAFSPDAAAKTARLKEEEGGTPIQQEGGDYIWKPQGATVPAVISGGDSWASVGHKAEAARDLQPGTVKATNELVIVDRLAERHEENDCELSSQLWRSPTTTPGVIRPKPPEDDFGFKW